MSIPYSLFPRDGPCPGHVLLLKKFIFASLGQRMGWSWPRSKLWPTTYAIRRALGCTLSTSLFTMVIRCNTQETKMFLKIYRILQQHCCPWSSAQSALSMACIPCMHITTLPKPLPVTVEHWFSHTLTGTALWSSERLRYLRYNWDPAMNALYCWPWVGLWN